MTSPLEEMYLMGKSHGFWNGLLLGMVLGVITGIIVLGLVRSGVL